MDMSISFPHLGIHLEHVGKTLTIFGFDIAYYGIVIALGMVLSVLLISYEVKRTGQDEDFYFNLIIAAIILGIIGARIYYVIFSWDYYSQHPGEIFNIRNGGLAIYGGLILGALTIFLMGKYKKMSVPLILDTICIGVPVGQILGRWGNFFNREAFGGYTDSLFAMALPVDAVRQNEITSQMWQHVQTIDGTQYIQVHPTFLYESLWNIGVLLLLFWISRRKKWDGQVFATYLAGYGMGRVWIESLRTDQLLLPGTQLPVSQLLSGALVIICLGILIYQKQKRIKTLETENQEPDPDHL